MRAAEAKKSMFEEAESGGYKRVQDLLDSGCVQVDCVDEELNTPLSIACANDRKKVAKVLMRAGANINHQNAEGRTPLHMCAENGGEELGQYLVSKGAGKLYPLVCAYAHIHIHVMSMFRYMPVRRVGLVQLTMADHSPDPNIQDFAGRTAMELAEHLDKEEEEKDQKEEEEEEPSHATKPKANDVVTKSFEQIKKVSKEFRPPACCVEAKYLTLIQ
jgi:ankyrin repeat protein